MKAPPRHGTNRYTASYIKKSGWNEDLLIASKGRGEQELLPIAVIEKVAPFDQRGQGAWVTIEKSNACLEE